MNAANTVKLFGIALFAGVLLAVVARQWLGPPVDIHENRELAARPGLPNSLDDWQAFPAAFTDYMNDHFGFRGRLLRGYNRALVALGVSPTESVILGREGWLFLEQEKLTDQNRGALPLSEDELGRYLEGFRAMRLILAQRGIPLLLLPVPDKQTLYPGKLPGWIRFAGPGRLDQVTGYLREAGEPFVDVLPALEAATAQGDRVYWQTDSHWTCLGALRAYQVLMDSIEAMGLPEVRRVSPAELEFTRWMTCAGKICREPCCSCRKPCESTTGYAAGSRKGSPWRSCA